MSSNAEDNAAAAAAAPGTVGKLSVLMPLYNERWTLATIIRRVLAVPLDLELELIVVDDGSSDGSWEELQRVAGGDPRIRVFRHDRNRGKGAAIRTAIATDDRRRRRRPGRRSGIRPQRLPAAVDAHPRRAGGRRLRLALQPARRTASSTSGTAWATSSSPCSPTWPTTSTSPTWRRVTRWCGPTCSASSASSSNTFTLEPEITCRLAQWGARIYEVPISYSGRTYLEGKKIKADRRLQGLRRAVPLPLARPAVHPSPRALRVEVDRPGPQVQPLAAGRVPPLAGRPHPGGRRRHRQPQRAVVEPLAAGSAGPRPDVHRPLAGPVRPARQRPRDPGRPDQARGRRPLEGRADRHRPVLRASWSTSVPTRRCCGSFHDALAARRPLPRRRAGGNVGSTTPWTAARGISGATTPAELREKMERAGFEVVFSRSVGKLAIAGLVALGPACCAAAG